MLRDATDAHAIARAFLVGALRIRGDDELAHRGAAFPLGVHEGPGKFAGCVHGEQWSVSLGRSGGYGESQNGRQSAGDWQGLCRLSRIVLARMSHSL